MDILSVTPPSTETIISVWGIMRYSKYDMIWYVIVSATLYKSNLTKMVTSNLLHTCHILEIGPSSWPPSSCACGDADPWRRRLEVGPHRQENMFDMVSKHGNMFDLLDWIMSYYVILILGGSMDIIYITHIRLDGDIWGYTNMYVYIHTKKKGIYRNIHFILDGDRLG